MDLELLSPIGFLEGIKDLGIVDLEEVEVACLMRVLTKPNLENAILLNELIVIMENFGITDDPEDEQELEQKQDEQQESARQKQIEKSKDSTQAKNKKKKKGQNKPVDLNQLDDKSMKTLAKLMLALIELEVSLYDFFDGVIYEQLVKTKTKQNVVEIINSKDFFDILQKRGVRKHNNEHENLKKFLQLDNNYPHLLMFKRIIKVLDEMSKNDELMAEIQAAAQDDGGEEGNEAEGSTKKGNRLNTIGEEDNQMDTKQDMRGGGKIKKQPSEEDYENEEYEKDEVKNGNQYEDDEEDYEF